MSAPILKAGASGPQTTRISKSVSDKSVTVVTVEGTYSALSVADPEDFVPEGLALESSTLSPTDGGMGTLTLNCRLYDDPTGTDLEPVRTTFEVGMEEVHYDLEDHPYLASARAKILMWLATDESKRVDGGAYKYIDKNGELTETTDEKVIMFCDAYMAGIKSFVRYYPVITKRSVWKNPPGLTRVGRSFTSGSLPFSADCGKFAEPPISLNGFPGENFFHGPMTWTQNENKTWTQTETWTYTPEGSNGDHAWIYASDSTDGGGDDGGDNGGDNNDGGNGGNDGGDNGGDNGDGGNGGND